MLVVEGVSSVVEASETLGLQALVPVLQEETRDAQNALLLFFSEKNPRVRKIRVRNSGAGNACANFRGDWKNAFFLRANLCP